MKKIKLMFLVSFMMLLLVSLTACDGYFTIRFDSNGGSSVESVQGDGLNMEAYIEIEPIPTRAGYEFAGWYKNKSCKGERITFPYISESKDGYSVTFYAKWIKN